MPVMPTRRKGIWTLALLIVLVAVASGRATAQDQDPTNPGKLTLTGSVDFGNAYMFRGIRQEDTKVIAWPAVDIGMELFSGEGRIRNARVNLGLWNSLHTGATGTGGASGKLWYEGDFYASFGLGFGGGLGVTTVYTAYTSPNDSFSTVKEFAFRVSFENEALLKKLGALHPYGLLAIEVDTSPGQGQADVGFAGGRYLEVGIVPAWSASPWLSFTFPVKTGLSLGNYYEGPTGDETDGYWGVAGMATVPLNKVPTTFGRWNVHGGVEFQKYGDTLRAFNLGKSHKVIVSGGIGLSY